MNFATTGDPPFNGQPRANVVILGAVDNSAPPSGPPLAVVNRGGATAGDVVRFAARVKRQVADRLGVWLQPEPVFVGFDAAPDLADLEYLRKAHH